MILSEQDELDESDFRFTPAADTSISLDLESNERRMVIQALEKAAGNISHAAETLGITRAALYRRIEKFDL